ncbi:hypothetical protein OUO13_02195 [Oceanospirillaceae bacterium G-43]|uniref:Uncharacterized protein n=1 Tax=Parathalassolituus penaei TaxID=2997323 RepID=A0A9X3EJY6_9GAMM|nr:solute carrier family 23 protein [Parathalassolituus penaei]MCY0963988.1 hypothetical protein [Parathalassolituus penaei]
MQHVLASIIGNITPALIVSGVLDQGEHMPYLISMALMMSGVATFLQVRVPFGVDTSMVCAFMDSLPQKLAIRQSLWISLFLKTLLLF